MKLLDLGIELGLSFALRELGICFMNY